MPISFSSHPVQQPRFGFRKKSHGVVENLQVVARYNPWPDSGVDHVRNRYYPVTSDDAARRLAEVREPLPEGANVSLMAQIRVDKALADRYHMNGTAFFPVPVEKATMFDAGTKVPVEVHRFSKRTGLLRWQTEFHVPDSYLRSPQ